MQVDRILATYLDPGDLHAGVAWLKPVDGAQVRFGGNGNAAFGEIYFGRTLTVTPPQDKASFLKGDLGALGKAS